MSRKSSNALSNLSQLTNDELISLRIHTELEMNSRGIEFSVGGVGEKLVINYFNSTTSLPNMIEAPRGAKNVDALSRDGERYSIKTVLKGKKTGTIYPDSEDRERQLFEFLLIVKLTEKYKLENIFRISWNLFKELRAWDRRMNAWYIPVSNKRLDMMEQIL